MARPRMKDIDSQVDFQDAATVDEATAIVKGGFAEGTPVPLPTDLETPQAAELWAQTELVKAKPRAVQEIIHQLRSGTKEERFKAAKEVLDRTPAQQRNSAPVIIINNNVVKQIPWAKKAKVVDSSVVQPKDSKEK